MPDSTILLFDELGRAYRFTSEEQVRPFRVDARTFAGLARQRAAAPAGTDAGTEVSGRHLGSDSEFYHTEWEYGPLRFEGQDGYVGDYLCLHAHLSQFSPRADYDPSCDMIPMGASAASNEEIEAR